MIRVLAGGRARRLGFRFFFGAMMRVGLSDFAI